MTEAADGVPTDFFRVQLNELFNRSEVRLTNRAVVRGMLALGCRISVPYLSQLRTGTRTAPSIHVVRTLADFFVVPVDYFSDPAYDPKQANIAPTDIDLIATLSDHKQRRLLHSTVGLSPKSYTLIIRLAEQLRLAEGLPATPDRHIVDYTATALELKSRPTKQSPSTQTSTVLDPSRFTDHANTCKHNNHPPSFSDSKAR